MGEKASGGLYLPRSGSAKYRVARNMVPARSWSPPPKIQSRRWVSQGELSVQRFLGDRTPLATQSSAPSRVRGNSPSLCRPLQPATQPQAGARAGGGPALGVQFRPNLEGRERFEMRARSAEASRSHLSPLPRSRLGGLLNATPTRVRERGWWECVYSGRGEAPEPAVGGWRGRLGLPTSKAGGYPAQPKRLN